MHQPNDRIYASITTKIVPDICKSPQNIEIYVAAIPISASFTGKGLTGMCTYSKQCNRADAHLTHPAESLLSLLIRIIEPQYTFKCKSHFW
jgi:hypothetical protein